MCMCYIIHIILKHNDDLCFKIKLTLRVFWVDRIVVDLKGGVDVRPREPDDVIAAVVHLGRDVADGDILGAQVVVQEHLSTNLKQNERKCIS